MRLRSRFGAATASATLAATLLASSASASVPHTVQPGETLWSIAAANGLSAQTVAAFNGLPAETKVTVGQTVEVPSAADGEVTVADAPGMAHIPSPWGNLHLDPAAAEAWNAMRAESLATFGVDLHPAGPVSAYRTYEQQADLYELHLEGDGAPANPPGSSAHETGTAVDVATPEMRDVIDQIGASYGWAKVEAPTEWWHVDYVGP